MSDIGGAIRSIDELVDEVTRLHVLLRGNRDYPGILEESVKLIDRLDGVAGHLASASLLSEQLGALPDRLLRSADDMQFRAALRESIAQVLADSIVDAKRHVQDEAAQIAIDELSMKINLAMANVGESSANLFAERNQLKGKFEAEREKNAVLVQRMKYFEQDKDNALRLISADFAAASNRAGKARLLDLCAGLVIGVVVSLTTLVPAAELYLKQSTQNHHQ
ncbi:MULTISPECIES: hypothetical protein [Pseudomonas]|uniref:hypothetical protein n=1 Tax=Pseudomonas TaxID=286 RepID=UPI000316EEBF|nr:MULTISPECIES: hypothetical protein [Pseudomonas]AIG02412.1 hypothetical protein HZ99_09700 [Pseudomonas fluorescens]MBK5342653.1 hypothetical protein [Pseudomonas sp. TH49]CDF95887.1 hypothetical protein BN844_2622 [Pseudomonas sp. SHC52]